jgi:DNA-binding NtrC family response regulator
LSNHRDRLVAIVDDDLDITELFHDALKPISRIVVFKFTDPVIALEHITLTLNIDKYVLIISDLRMPNVNGLELLNKVKKINPNIRTVLMTAFEITDKLFMQYAREQIINSFLQKPILIKDLVEEADKQLHIHEVQLI